MFRVGAQNTRLYPQPLTALSHAFSRRVPLIFLSSTARFTQTRPASFSTSGNNNFSSVKIQNNNHNYTADKTTTMALPPKFSGARMVFFPGGEGAASASPSSASELHTVEIFLDYACPFSAKMFRTLQTAVFPSIPSSSSTPIKAQFIFRHQLQPWHPSSTLLHEASLAILQMYPGQPSKFWKFSEALFTNQKSFFDASVVNETRNATYRRLASLAKQSVDADEDQVYGLLEVSDKPSEEDGGLNSGNKVTNDVKLVVKMARLVGVHVSPTVVFDGVIAGNISSSWTGEQWMEWLGKNAT